MRGHCKSDGQLGDYCVGSDFATHLLFSTEKKSLQILLYYDHVEVCNPLGTKENFISLVCHNSTKK